MFGLTIGCSTDNRELVIEANILFYNVNSLKELYTQIVNPSISMPAYYKAIACNINVGVYESGYHLHSTEFYVDEEYDNCVSFEFTLASPTDGFDNYTLYIDVDTLNAVIKVESTIEDYTVHVFEYPIQLGTSTSIRDLINKQMSQVAFPSNELRGPFVDEGEGEP